jgi:diacylglycerol kinase (ATP)
MATFSSVTIIYNPNSTGSGKKLARALQTRLGQTSPQLKVAVVATKYAGHAEELAYELARASARPLIISASGDGGYNEVINGLVRAQKEGAHPVAGLLPAGNANDHYHSVHAEEELEYAIPAGKTQRVDLLRLETTVKGKPFERYAHSYIGFGLTSKAGNELNKTKVNRMNEVWIVLKVLLFLRPVHLVIKGRERAYDSVIFSNVSRMSKVLSFSKDARNDDGKFETTLFRRRSRLRLIAALLKASTTGLAGAEQASTYSFATTRAALVQLDGEVFRIDSRSKATVTAEHTILECVI